MFRKHLGFRKKSSNETAQPQPPRATPEFLDPNDNSRGRTNSNQENYNSSTKSLTLESERSISPNSQVLKKTEVLADPLGLNVIYSPENGHKVDIVFIHGLGGTSRLSWSKHKDPDLFWPLTFLPLEPDVCLARILTFGYNANIRKASNTGTSVLDFAKDLLFDLKYAKNGEMEELNMGSVPIIFVVHSMGGLIVKEAYMQGQNDPEYEGIIKAVSAITFLSTPHRGSNLADTLNRILQSTFITNSKQHISELARNSFTLQKLNEQFRHIAPRLDIVSFYETQPTSIGLKNARVMVLERDSSVLGYPGETSKPLDADHHSVCKYDSPKDPNYITVRNVLKSLVSKIITSARAKEPLPKSRRESQDLKSALAITEMPDVDYIFFRDQWVPGTSDWILLDQAYLEWVNTPQQTPQLLWLHGGAATGKSVLSSFLINNLIEQGACCQYFFIRFGDQNKRTVSTLLRSLAFQMAQQIPEFYDEVIQLANEAIKFETADSRTIWERIFKSILLKMNPTQPIYWIIDGVDEADNPRAILKLISESFSSNLPLRVLLVSRKTSELTAVFSKLPPKLNLNTISIDGHLSGLRHYILQELNMPGTAEFMEKVIERVLGGAQNNFLWVRLAVEKLNLCHIEADVERALQELPIGMEALYDRMALSISQNASPTDKALALAVLECVTCSLRVLTVAELSQALDKDTQQVLDFQRSIGDLCGGFVVIDNSGNVAMIHQTAREYLLGGKNRPFQVDRNSAHEQMFLSCLKSLTAVGLRTKINRDQKPEYLDYAASSWSTHLISVRIDSDKVLAVLQMFLKGNFVLTWIQIITIQKQLRVLVQSSRHLSKYANKRREYDSLRHPLDRQIVEQELVDSWAIDLVKIVGKFGTNLQRNSESIYKLIPPFCPQNSSVYKLFGKKEVRNLMVSGLSNNDWDDSLARISLGFGVYASTISAAGSRIAIMASSGSVFIYNSSTFEETVTIKHGERLYRMEMNSTATLLATYGYRTTKIWEISTGNCKLYVSNIESRPRPLAMLFSNNNSTLLVATDDKRIRSLDLTESEPVWQLMAELEEPELEGHFLNASSYMALNNEGTLVAVAYRGHPLSAWEIDGPEHIGHCWRTRDELARGEVIQAVWLPYSSEVLGLYIEGVVFKWSPYGDDTSELSTGASRLALSRDGNIFVTGDVHGSVKVYSTQDFTLIYQLTSQDRVIGLAFGPDPCRFYDIRDSYTNVWEPNALMRLTEQTEKGSDSNSETESISQVSMVSMSLSRKISPVTALSSSPIGRFYCCGTEEGTVHLYELQRGKVADLHVSKSFMSIEKMSWSNDGRYICFSDSSKRIFIKSVKLGKQSPAGAVETNIEIPMNIITKGPVIQLLFQPDSSHLLVYTSSTLSIISMASFSIVHTLEWKGAECKWIVLPDDPTLILGVGPGTIRTLDWSLAERQRLSFSNGDQSTFVTTNLPDLDVVDRVVVTRDKKHVLVELSSSGEASRRKVFFLLGISTLSLEESNQGNPILSLPLPPSFSSTIAIPLSFLSRERLVYLSKDFSICSMQLPGLAHQNSSTNASNMKPMEDRKLLFSLPSDWINRDCLALSSIWNAERSFLCPRNGEVAVIRSSALV
ncbi:NACHT and WD domain protein [Halenospora varia]|nr:NACHT and WD domain protein [Halenospora varia]